MNCRVEGGSWGDQLSGAGGCADCTVAWDLTVVYAAGTGPRCENLGLNVQTTTSRAMGYAPTHDDGTTVHTNALLARDPSGTWAFVGTVDPSANPITYTLEQGEPSWERPEASE